LAQGARDKTQKIVTGKNLRYFWKSVALASIVHETHAFSLEGADT
jgi:hypothetical protein